MYAECVDAVIAHVSGQDTCKPWQKNTKGGLQQRPLVQVPPKTKTSVPGTSRPEPMELEMARR